MEQTPSYSLFSLSVDPVTKAHLHETAKWARFLAIIGMVFLIFGVIGILFFVTAMTSYSGSFDSPYGSGMPFPGFGLGIALVYIILLVVWFFPLMYLLRFANRMRTALHGNDQQGLNIAFQNLKICFRFLGIVTIIVLAFYALAIIFAIVGAAAFS